MAAYTDWICERIRCGEPEAFLGAHEVLLQLRTSSPDGGGCEPWASRIKQEPPMQADAQRIREALLDALENGTDLAVAGAAFALTELQDESLIPELRKVLISTES